LAGVKRIHHSFGWYTQSQNESLQTNNQTFPVNQLLRTFLGSTTKKSTKSLLSWNNTDRSLDSKPWGLINAF
jgi:hypothetical protein